MSLHRCPFTPILRGWTSVLGLAEPQQLLPQTYLPCWYLPELGLANLTLLRTFWPPRFE